MAMSRSFREYGSDEVQEQVSDICCFCANNNNTIQPASYFCLGCGNVGKFLCDTCLRNHNLFVGNHDVIHIGSQSNSRFVEKEKKLQKLEGDVKQLLAEKEILKSELALATADRDDQQQLIHVLEKQLKDLHSRNAKLAIEEKNETSKNLDGESKGLNSEVKVMKSQLDKSKVYVRQTVINDLAKMPEKSKSENKKMTSQTKTLLTWKTKFEEERTKGGDAIKNVTTEQSALGGNIEKLRKYKETPNCDNLRNFDYLDWDKCCDVIEESDNPRHNPNTKKKQPQEVSCGMGPTDKLLVAAIDVGTTFSGYAFSFKHDHQMDPSKVSTNGYWDAGSQSLMSLKAPKVVLFDENKRFHSFGYEAENKYSELALDDEHHKWYFFKRFKMIVHDKYKLSRDTEIDDVKGRKMKAIDVFGAVINYLKDHLLNLLRRRDTWIKNQDIHWVLPVPAIYSELAKQFMREAANQADIDNSQLSIVSDSVAASLFCELIPTDMIHGSEGTKFALTTPGTKYMVIDIGGLTCDITVHERRAGGGLIELHRTGFTDLRGTKVDEEFYALLIRRIGGQIYRKFMYENQTDHLDLQRELETKKRTITPQSNGKITIKMPSSIANTYKNEMKKEIKDAIAGSPYSGKIIWSGDKMRIDVQIFKDIFKSCTDKIASHVTDLLKKPDVQGTNIFLMVGGFSESKMVQDAIMKALPNGKVIIPHEAGLAVLKGAVMLGRWSVPVTSRVSKYTYGISILPAFDPTLHSENHRVVVGGIARCRDVFKQYVHSGETVEANEARSRIHVTLKSNQMEMRLKLFASPKVNPMYIDEVDTMYLGDVVVYLPDNGNKRKVEVTMKFGGTEVTVEAREMLHNKTYRGSFDFL